MSATTAGLSADGRERLERELAPLREQRRELRIVARRNQLARLDEQATAEAAST
ncbi:MAG: hypothetical protein ACRDRX_01360 [Pseudonocardiaceae bacterium]